MTYFLIAVAAFCIGNYLGRCACDDCCCAHCVYDPCCNEDCTNCNDLSEESNGN
jgi:hypothetical protein